MRSGDAPAPDPGVCHHTGTRSRQPQRLPLSRFRRISRARSRLLRLLRLAWVCVLASWLRPAGGRVLRLSWAN
jgi:hypothetical protein